MQHLYYEGLKNKNYFYMELDQHILFNRRKELKMTQQQVADKSGIHLRQYQRLENGERSISGSSGRIVLSVCEALKLDPYLFLGKGNEKPETKYLILPPVEKEFCEYVVPSLAYYNIVSMIPRGMVCTDDELYACLRKAYGSDTLEIKTDRNSVEIYANNDFPFWRVVSQRGYLINSFYCSKEKQKEKLEAEGIIVNKKGENESYCVNEFEYCHFDVANLKITVMKTDKQLFEQFGIV